MPPKNRRPSPKAAPRISSSANRGGVTTRKRQREQEAESASVRVASETAPPRAGRATEASPPNASPTRARAGLPRARGRRRTSHASTTTTHETRTDGSDEGDKDDEPNAANGSGLSSSSFSRGGGREDDEGMDATPDAAADSAEQSASFLGEEQGQEKARGRKGSRELTDTEVVAEIEKRLVDYHELERSVAELQGRRQAGNAIADIIANAQSATMAQCPVIRLVVGGESFTVPLMTLLSRDSNSYFHAIVAIRSKWGGGVRKREAARGQQAALAAAAAATTTVATVAGGDEEEERQVEEHALEHHASTQAGGQPTGTSRQGESVFHKESYATSPFPADVFRDDSGAIFLDRDPATFRHILNYLRGYSRFHMLEEEELHKLRVDAHYFQLQGLQELIREADTTMDLQFQPGPGVNKEGSRFRVVYSVATVGEAFMVTGRHSITFQIISNDYVGVGIVSDSFANADAEFHKTLNCAVYYMSGVFYTNYPNYRKEEGLAKFENGDYVTVLVDMDKGFAEMRVRKASKVFSLGGARRLKFAVTLKLGSGVRIVPPGEAAEQAARLEAEEDAAAYNTQQQQQQQQQQIQAPIISAPVGTNAPSPAVPTNMLEPARFPAFLHASNPVMNANPASGTVPYARPGNDPQMLSFVLPSGRDGGNTTIAEEEGELEEGEEEGLEMDGDDYIPDEDFDEVYIEGEEMDDALVDRDTTAEDNLFQEE